MIEINDIMKNSIVAIIGKTELSKDLEGLFCPPKVGIAKPLLKL